MPHCTNCGSDKWVIKSFNLFGDLVYPSEITDLICAKCGIAYGNLPLKKQFFQLPLAEDFEIRHKGNRLSEPVDERGPGLVMFMCPQCRRLRWSRKEKSEDRCPRCGRESASEDRFCCICGKEFSFVGKPQFCTICGSKETILSLQQLKEELRQLHDKPADLIPPKCQDW